MLPPMVPRPTNPIAGLVVVLVDISRPPFDGRDVLVARFQIGRGDTRRRPLDHTWRELEGSLSRLGVDAVDLYQIHSPIPPEQIEEGWSTLAELKAEGLVRHIG